MRREISVRTMYAALCAVALLFPFAAQAQISLDNVILRFEVNKRPVQNLIVRNSAEHVTYVTVEVEEAESPGPDAQFKPSNDLLISPKAFSIEPNGQRTVRMLLQKPPGEAERVFRVGFVPQDRGFGKEIRKTAGGHTTVLRVMTGMGALVFVDPLHPNPQFRWERTGDKITFTNTGSVNIYFGDGKVCTTENDCQDIKGGRVYAGGSLEITAAPSKSVTFLHHHGGTGSYQRLTIQPGNGSGTVQTSLESQDKTN